jgi:hypothetical protein
MHFIKPIAIFISGIFTPAVVDAFMIIAPPRETSINAVFARFSQRLQTNPLLRGAGYEDVRKG